MAASKPHVSPQHVQVSGRDSEQGSERVSEQHRQNEKTGQQGTHEPWKKPGQSSQDPSHPPPNERRTDKDEKTS